MKILTSPSSGSIAGTVFSHNRAGQYTRNRRTPVVGTRTPRQAVVKGNMTIASQSWQSLSPTVQAAWTAYASGHPIVDALGQSIKLTGAQYYIKCAAALLNVNNALPTNPPASDVITPETVVGWNVTSTGLAFVVRSGGINPDNIALSVSKLTSAGVNFMQTYHQVLADSDNYLFYDLSGPALAWAGTFTLGQKLWLRDVPVTEAGLTGSPFIAQTIVVAAMPLTAPVLTSTVAGDVTATFTYLSPNSGVHLQTGPTATGPWTDTAEQTSTTSPATFTGLTSGQYARAVVFDNVLGTTSGWSNSILIM